MKKRILQIALASMFVFYVSCSNESDVITQESGTNSSIVKSGGLSQTELEDAIKMYDRMIETTEYKAFNLAFMDFNQKLVVQGLSFSSKTDAIAWISGNLSSTNFSSVNEFESDLDNLTGAMGSIMSNNMGLFNALSNASIEQTIQIVKPKVPTVEYPIERNDCQLDCIISYDNNRAAAEAAYNAESAEINFTGDDFENLMTLVKLTALERDYRNLLNDLIYSFNNCITGCGS